ncbi:hypothetical protein LUW76_17955 [Actinomadura madurae]|nr:hypothetical protein [Actinomadura madurae]URM96059.1 hypothetical protein LUW76_17955 [Actinomadura madurae]
MWMHHPGTPGTRPPGAVAAARRALGRPAVRRRDQPSGVVLVGWACV